MSQLLGNRSRGLLFILSAPAGTGKTTLVRKLTGEFDCVVESISFTSRPMRRGEKEGVDYFFVDEETFERMAREDAFLESVSLYGFYYGTSKSWVEEMLAQGKHVVLVIDTQGALKLKRDKSLQAVYIFIKPPSLAELKSRLEKRKTEDSRAVEERLHWAEKELKEEKEYDYVILNDEIEKAYQVLKSIFIAEEHKRS